MYNVEDSFTRYMKQIGSNILFSSLPGEKVKEIRKSIELSQDNLSKLLGIRRETVSRIETGAISPTSYFIKKFSKMRLKMPTPKKVKSPLTQLSLSPISPYPQANLKPSWKWGMRVTKKPRRRFLGGSKYEHCMV
jgi:transcriptional regulator with XRE-family HTH domain